MVRSLYSQAGGQGYRAVGLPSPIRTGIGNFFNNLREPIVILNDLFQGKFKQALSDTGRFLVNTTVGIGGLLDPATPLGMTRHNEDFGQTLAVTGRGRGSYIVLPFLGPSNVRDSAGIAVDCEPSRQTAWRRAARATSCWCWRLSTSARNCWEASDILDQAAGQDPFTFVHQRPTPVQRRRNLVFGGNPLKTAPPGACSMAAIRRQRHETASLHPPPSSESAMEPAIWWSLGCRSLSACAATPVVNKPSSRRKNSVLQI